MGQMWFVDPDTGPLLEADDKVIRAIATVMVRLASERRALVALFSELVTDDGVETHGMLLVPGVECGAVVKSIDDAPDPELVDRMLESIEMNGHCLFLDAHDQPIMDPLRAAEVKARAVLH